MEPSGLVAQFLNDGMHHVLQAQNPDGQQDAAEPHALSDRVHPGVVLGLLQTSKWLAKGQVADDVEGGPVVPADHVEGYRLLFLLLRFLFRRHSIILLLLLAKTMAPQPANQSIHIPPDNPLLRPHAALTEPMRHQLSQHAMILSRLA